MISVMLGGTKLRECKGFGCTFERSQRHIRTRKTSSSSSNVPPISTKNFSMTLTHYHFGTMVPSWTYYGASMEATWYRQEGTMVMLEGTKVRVLKGHGGTFGRPPRQIRTRKASFPLNYHF